MAQQIGEVIEQIEKAKTKKQTIDMAINLRNASISLSQAAILNNDPNETECLRDVQERLRSIVERVERRVYQ